MKRIAFALLLLTSTLGAKAQHAFDITDYNKKLAKIDTLCDKVYSVNIVNDTLTILAMGGYPPHQKFNIAAKGNGVNMDLTLLKNKKICVIGTFMKEKLMPQVVITRAREIVVDTLPHRNK